jgi:hypothetical protein
MKRILDVRMMVGLLAVVLLAGAGETFAQRRRPVLRHRAAVKRRVVTPAVPVYTVSMGTIVRVRMNSTITSRSARVGDTFTTTVTEPVYSTNGVVVIPIGSTVTGRVDSVIPAGKQGKPGQIDAHFTTVRLPNGRSRAINGSLTDLSEGKTVSDNEGSASAKKMNNRKIIFIGGGAAGGAILGGAIGGGKGAAIGAILGGAGGILGERLTKGPEAEVRSGTVFGVYLNQAISMPKFAETNPVNP